MSRTEPPEYFFQVVTAPAAHALSQFRAIIRIYLVSTGNIANRAEKTTDSWKIIAIVLNNWAKTVD
jgi:hypothetical protein